MEKTGSKYKRVMKFVTQRRSADDPPLNGLDHDRSGPLVTGLARGIRDGTRR